MILEEGLPESVLTGVRSGVLGEHEDKIFLVNKSALELLESDAGKLIDLSVFNVFPTLTKAVKSARNSELSFREELLDYKIKGIKKSL